MNPLIAASLRQAVANHQAGNLDAARSGYEDILRREPGQADALHLLGVLYDQQGDHAQAVDLIGQAIAIVPGEASFHGNLGTALLAMKAFDKAEAAYRQAVNLERGYAEGHYNLANLLRRRGDADAARAAFEEALELQPDHLQARNNLAMLLWEDIGDRPAAARHFQHLLQVAPNWAVGRMNHSLFLLAGGDYAAGWTEYEWRWRNPDYAERDWGLGLPRWTGEPSKGASLLLWGEQGAGDQILYGTMLRDAQRRWGGPIIIAVEPRLVGLFAHSLGGGVTVVARGTPVTAAVQCPFASIGRWLRGKEADFTPGALYLQPDPQRRDNLYTAYRAMAGGRALAGLSWRSGNTSIGQDKSIQLPALLPLLRRPDIFWVSLQYGDIAKDLSWLQEQGITIHHDPAIDSLHDLEGFAAQVAALDHVVTVSNTAVHVAGAMGVPTDLLLASGRGKLWYWPASGTESRWYASVTIRRQARPGDWAAPVAAVQALGLPLKR